MVLAVVLLAAKAVVVTVEEIDYSKSTIAACESMSKCNLVW